tara:strand:+ start:1536 stop:1961 length:426 start_codon:yes stop_codon:yes gene_type:complete
MYSASQCGPECMAQVIQSTQDASQSARSAASSVASIVTAIEEMRIMIEENKDIADSAEGQIIQLRIDMQGLSENIETLKLSVDESMIPTIDNNVLKLVVAVLSAFTLCIVVCQLVIFYSSRETIKKEKTIKVKNRNRIDII